MDELQEMREQMAVLKEKLNKQEVVNDRLIRDVLIKKKKSVDKNIWFVGVCGLFAITVGNWTFFDLGVSTWFLIGTTVLMLASFLLTIIPHNWVKKADIQSGNLLVAAKQARRLRKLYKDWEIIGIVLSIIWVGWLFAELASAVDDKQLLYPLIGGSIFSGIIGGIVGLRVSRKTINTLDEMIQDIETTSNLDGEEKVEEVKE
jgi:hypothetical protein